MKPIFMEFAKEKETICSGSQSNIMSLPFIWVISKFKKMNNEVFKFSRIKKLQRVGVIMWRLYHERWSRVRIRKTSLNQQYNYI